MNKIIIYFYKTALNVAIEKNYSEIVRLLLTNDNIDVNIKNIIINFFYILHIKKIQNLKY